MPLDDAIQQAKRDLINRGCSEAQAVRVLALLQEMGIAAPQLQRWIDDLWDMVSGAFDAVQKK